MKHIILNDEIIIPVNKINEVSKYDQESDYNYRYEITFHLNHDQYSIGFRSLEQRQDSFEDLLEFMNCDEEKILRLDRFNE